MTLSQQDFSFVAGLVRREASIVLAPGKEYLVEARLIRWHARSARPA